MSKTIKIISWNVNGLRAIYKKGSFSGIFKLKPDILCLQETKCSPDQLTPEVLSPKGYKSYFSWPTEKRGYSGVAIYTKDLPINVVNGIGKPEFDNEGRVITAYYNKFILINVYFPNGGSGPIRLKYKLDFYNHFLKYIEKLAKTDRNIVFCGDVNTAHTEIDLARPRENEKNTGFLPIERKWIDKVISKNYIDVYRKFYPKRKDTYTYWDSKTFSRDRNVGWRIDYFFASKSIVNNVANTNILNDVYGSDHCPLSLTLKF